MRYEPTRPSITSDLMVRSSTAADATAPVRDPEQPRANASARRRFFATGAATAGKTSATSLAILVAIALVECVVAMLRAD